MNLFQCGLFKAAFFLVGLLAAFQVSISGCTTERRGQASVLPENLTCEYLVSPVGLDVATPRFSWTLTATNPKAFGQRQTAYRVLVSRSLKELRSGIGDVWDSGWVESDQMQLIEYDGEPLQSDRDYYWKVAVKDEEGNVSRFSEAVKWSTGLFSVDEWRATWIGTDEVYNPAEGPNKMQDPWFRKTFDLDKKPGRAILFVTSVGYHEVYVNGKKIGDHVLAPAVTDHTQRARYIAYDIAPALTRGKNCHCILAGNVVVYLRPIRDAR